MKYKVGTEGFDNQKDYRKALNKSNNRDKSYDYWDYHNDSELVKLSETMLVPELADYFKRIIPSQEIRWR